VVPIRVAIVDDDTLVRRALTAYVDSADDMTVVGEAEDGEQALGLVERLTPDVVLMDLRMPHLSGLDATSTIVESTPHCRVIALTTLATADSVVPVLRAGAAGYLLKDAAPADILDAIRSVHDGSGALSPRVSGEIIKTLQSSPADPAQRPRESERLSARETEVVEQLAMGKSNSEIARSLHLSEGTVKAHLTNIMLKWNVRDRVQVLLAAARFGIVRLH